MSSTQSERIYSDSMDIEMIMIASICGGHGIFFSLFWSRESTLQYCGSTSGWGQLIPGFLHQIPSCDLRLC